MSKIIFLGTPAHGHVNPTLAVVQELVQRGEEVLYYNDQEFRPQIERANAIFRPYPPASITSKAIVDALADGNLASVSVLTLQTTETMLPFILAELERERPDLVIFDSLAVWGKMATTILKQRAAASITHFVFDLKTGRVKFRETVRMVRLALPHVPKLMEARNLLTRQYGSDAFPPTNPLFPMRDRLNIVFTSRQLQPDMSLLDDTFRFVGPSITARPVENDIPFHELGSSVVYISMGTIHTGQLAFYQSCFEAFRGIESHFILSVGRATDIAALGSIPPNFIVRNFVPQLQVLQYSKAFITHGGMNSIHEGLYYGVPQIIIPHQFEQLLNARCVEVNGAALVIDKLVAGKSLESSDLRTALDAITSNPSYRKSAHMLQLQLQATGGFRQAADEIQHYIATTPLP